MDCGRRFSSLLIISFIFIYSHNISSEKVSLELYYESLCPYCSNFIVNYLPQLFQNGLISVVDLKLYPYGNAKILSDGSIKCQYKTLCPDSIDFIVNNSIKIFENKLIFIVDLRLFPCGNGHIRSDNTFDFQHGEMECLLNTIETCAIDAWPDLNTHFGFVYCVEQLVFNKKFSEWETCFDTVGLERTPVDLCYKNGRGKELEMGYAKEIAALKPPHQYVPWVVVDGEPLYDEYTSFMSFICNAYKGSSPPEACNNLQVIRNVQVSYKGNFTMNGRSEDDTSEKAEKFARSKMILK